MIFDPISFLQRLIKFDTTNPPGQEEDCILFIKDTLSRFGIKSDIYTQVVGRPNLVARLKGKGSKAPLLLYGHVDVVPALTDDWIVPPFSGDIHEDLLYGRGALDMKGGIAMLVGLFIKMSKRDLKHDLILTIVSDEEVAGECGAQFLVENHAELFNNVSCAIGEFGGFPININNKKTYLIQVGEKQVCWLRLRLEGSGGHASLPHKNGVLAKLANILIKLNEYQLPIIQNDLTDRIFEDLALLTDSTKRMNSEPIKDQSPYHDILDRLGPNSALFSAMSSNTVNVTKISSGTKTNVLPREVILEMDGRLLPGQTPEDLITTLSNHLDINPNQFSIIKHVPNPQIKTNWALYDFLVESLISMEPFAKVIPLLMGGSTDARHFAKLGIQTYGFLPMNLPKDFSILNKIHGVNECIPTHSLEFGINTLDRFMNIYEAS